MADRAPALPDLAPASGHAPGSAHAPAPAPALTSASASELAPLSSARGERIVVAACVAVTAYFLGQVLLFDYGRDQGIYAMVAKAVTEGKMPYRDAWDMKPPGIFLFYAAARALFGASQRGIRVLEVLGLAATVFGLVRLARVFWGKPAIGAVAAALTALVHAQLDFWHTAQPESFGGMLTVAGLLLGWRPAEPGGLARRWQWAASGALFGAAGLLKPPLAGGAAVLAAFHAAGALGQGRRGGAFSPVLIFAAGGAAPIALCAAWFAAEGALPDLVETLFVFTPHYTALGWQGSSLGGMIWWGFIEWLTGYASPLTVGVLLLLGLGTRPHERPKALLLASVIAVHIAGVVAQGKFFPYHYGATWPLTALLAALGFFRVWELAEARIAPRWGAGAAAAAFVAAAGLSAFGRSATKDTPDSFLARCGKRALLVASGLRDQEALDALASVADVNAGANRAVAAWLRERVPADRSVFVWGFEPVVYDLAGRRPATRFLYDVPQRVAWAKAAMRERLIRDLDADPPAAIVVEHRDVFPMVTGDVLDSADALAGFPELFARIERSYELATTIEDFDVYLESAEQASE